MFPLLAAVVSSIVITPGEVPVVTDIHPDETAWIEQIKESRREDHATRILISEQARPPFAITHYPPETVDAILRTYFYTDEGLHWARLVGPCESSWRIDALGALGEVGWFQHRPEFWPNRSRWAGYPGGDIWNPEINTAVAAWMFYSPDFGPSHWSCSKRVGL